MTARQCLASVVAGSGSKDQGGLSVGAHRVGVRLGAGGELKLRQGGSGAALENKLLAAKVTAVEHHGTL